MSPSTRRRPSRAASAPQRLHCCRVVLVLVLGLLAGPRASAQDREPPPLRLGGVVPGGVRLFATECWGTYDFNLTNLSDTDRRARVLLYHEDREDVQYGREVWVPAHSTLSTWMLVGPPGKQSPGLHNIKILLYDCTTGQDHLLLPPGEERDRKGVVNYRARDRFTAILLDEEVPEATAFGQLPQPDSHNDESTRLARTFRHAAELSEQLQLVNPGPLPPTIEGLDGVNHFLLASGRTA